MKPTRFSYIGRQSPALLIRDHMTPDAWTLSTRVPMEDDPMLSFMGFHDHKEFYRWLEWITFFIDHILRVLGQQTIGRWLRLFGILHHKVVITFVLGFLANSFTARGLKSSQVDQRLTGNRCASTRCLVYRSSGQHQGKIDLRAKERSPKASLLLL